MKECREKCCTCTDFNKRFCKKYKTYKAPEKIGDLQFFQELWLSKPHKCWITDDPLYEFNIQSFFHVLPKGSYGKFRFEEKNVIFVKPILHKHWHSLGRSDLLKSDKRWQRVFDLYEELKQQYCQGRV